MTALIVAMSVIAAGAWLRWALIPAAAAFRLGMRYERIMQRRDGAG